MGPWRWMLKLLALMGAIGCIWWATQPHVDWTSTHRAQANHSTHTPAEADRGLAFAPPGPVTASLAGANVTTGLTTPTMAPAAPVARPNPPKTLSMAINASTPRRRAAQCQGLQLLDPKAYGPHMVLQQGHNVCVMGSGALHNVTVVLGPGKSCEPPIPSARWYLANVRAVAPCVWEACFGRISASPETFALNLCATPTHGPRTHVAVSDVAVGDVYVCAGQSNMEYHLRLELASRPHAPAFHTAPDQPPNRFGPRRTTAEKWVPSDPLLRLWKFQRWFLPRGRLQTSAGALEGVGAQYFSAVCFQFGLDLRKRDPRTPVGLMEVAEGGAALTAFLPAATPCLPGLRPHCGVQHRLPAFEGALLHRLAAVVRPGGDIAGQKLAALDATHCAAGARAAPQSVLDPAVVKGLRSRQPKPRRSQSGPGAGRLWDVVASLGVCMNITAVLWYQGEADAPVNHLHECRLRLFMRLLRALWAPWQRSCGAAARTDAARAGPGALPRATPAVVPCRPLPIVAVVLSSISRAEGMGGFPYSRAAIINAMRALPQPCAVTTAHDLGGASHETHPPSKRELGHRLFRATEHVLRRTARPWAGPCLRRVFYNASAQCITVELADHASLDPRALRFVGQCSASSPFQVFADRKWQALHRFEVSPGALCVFVSEIHKVRAVRFNFDDALECFVHNAIAMPLLPFEIPWPQGNATHPNPWTPGSICGAP